MPLNQEPLELDPEPRSVQVARRWIVDRFEAIGRTELVDCAELAISELVTNALLHARRPISIRLRGTLDHPRVDVTDGSRQPPALQGPAADGVDDLLITFGRGLDLVARCSVAWGASIEPEGKIVWFEPADEPNEDLPPRGSIFDEAEDDDIPRDGPTALIRLTNMPVATLLGLRNHNAGLRRELRLISLARHDTYPLATEITELFRRYDANWPSTLPDAADRAAADGVPVIDQDVSIPIAALPVLAHMRKLLASADQFCEDQKLLTIARSPHQRQFQDWLLDEFERQAAGQAPRPWQGATPATENPA